MGQVRVKSSRKDFLDVHLKVRILFQHPRSWHEATLFEFRSFFFLEQWRGWLQSAQPTPTCDPRNWSISQSRSQRERKEREREKLAVRSFSRRGVGKLASSVLTSA